MIDFTPDPVAIQIGPLPIYWYGLAYVLAILGILWLSMREARRRGQNPEHIANAAIPIAVAALIGARLYHVVDQWAIYRDNLVAIVLPPYSGLGIYGALIGGVIALIVYCRWKGLTFLLWADIMAPAILLGQAIARWGNFFNQELYGGPTTLPWGIAIQCQHRVPAYACPPGSSPTATLGQFFHPLFLYESLLSLLGVVVLLTLARRLGPRLRLGDVLVGYLMWYGAERFVLEFFRANNWVILGVPTAQWVSVAVVLGGLVVLAIRHRPGAVRSEHEIELLAGAPDGPPPDPFADGDYDPWPDQVWDGDEGEDSGDGEDAGQGATEPSGAAGEGAPPEATSPDATPADPASTPTDAPSAQADAGADADGMDPQRQS